MKEEDDALDRAKALMIRRPKK
jgi:GNAT superfamily N-acetyltransferase